MQRDAAQVGRERSSIAGWRTSLSRGCRRGSEMQGVDDAAQAGASAAACTFLSYGRTFVNTLF